MKKHFHYYRPYFADYIHALIAHPRIKFAVYTSIMRKNVMPLLFHIFNSQKLTKERQRIFDVFDQEYNVPDVGPGKEAWATKRKLEKVFDFPKAQKMGFDFHNTLMVDSEWDKVRDYEWNSLVVPTYTLDDVKSPAVNEKTSVLLKVAEFICKLCDEADDVQEYLKEHKGEFLKDFGVKDHKEEEEEKKETDELAQQMEKKLKLEENQTE